MFSMCKFQERLLVNVTPKYFEAVDLVHRACSQCVLKLEWRFFARYSEGNSFLCIDNHAPIPIPTVYIVQVCVKFYLIMHAGDFTE